MSEEKKEGTTEEILTPEEIERRSQILGEVMDTARDVVMSLMRAGINPFAIVDICAIASATTAVSADVTREEFLRLAAGAYDSGQRRLEHVKETMPPEIQRFLNGTATPEDMDKLRARAMAELGPDAVDPTAEPSDPSTTN